MLVHRSVTPSIKFAGTHLFTWAERGTVRVKCLAQEQHNVPRPGLEPGPLAPETRALTMRPPRLPRGVTKETIPIHKTKQSLSVVAIVTLLAPVSFCLTAKYPHLQPLK